MNVHDSERIAGLLESEGFEPARGEEDADVFVINTCSVRERAEDKLYTRLGEIRQDARASGRSPLIAVAGCVAQQEGATLLTRGSNIDVVLGTRALHQLPALLESARRTGARSVDV